MRYTKRTLVVSQSRISDPEARVARGQNVQPFEDVDHPAVNAIVLLLVMEQSLLSMKRFLSTLEHDLALSLGLDKPLRAKKAARYRATRWGEDDNKTARGLSQ